MSQMKFDGFSLSSALICDICGKIFLCLILHWLTITLIKNGW